MDAFLDLALEEDLNTVFWNANNGGDANAMGESCAAPTCSSGLPMQEHMSSLALILATGQLFGLWVRERQVMSLEQAIHKLTFHVASIFGLSGRGLLRPGYAADLVVFDPKTVNSHEPEWANDYPAGSKRLIQRSDGIHYTIVNGKIIHENGRMTGDCLGLFSADRSIVSKKRQPDGNQLHSCRKTR